MPNQIESGLLNNAENSKFAASHSQVAGDAVQHMPPLSASQIQTVMEEFFLRTSEAAYVVDPFNGRLMYANNAAENFFNRPEKSLNGISIEKLYSKCPDALYVFIDKALCRGSARSRTLTLFRADGAQQELEHSATAIESLDSTLLLVRVLDLEALHQRDFNNNAEQYLKKGIPAWLRDEQYLREIEREYRLILASAGEGIYGVDINGRTTFLNPAAELILGYSADELIGVDMHEHIHHHRSDGTEYPKEQCMIINSFTEGKVCKVTNEVFWRKDGSAVQVEYTSTPITDDGNKVGAVIVFRDITERVDSENKLRTALIDNAALHEKLELENAYLQEEIRQSGDHVNVIGNSESIKTLLTQIDMVAQTEANVLITGEGGTGKELTAYEIHRASGRSERPLIRVNCAAISQELFESELFGHAKGSFPGAIKNKVGKFELADGGTLYLDEVGDLDLVSQAKLLRVLQECKFERIGEELPIKMNIRLIASTNKDLKLAVDRNEFREDLYFALNVFPIECVPLRQRKTDIPLLAEHHLYSTCVRLNLALPKITKANVKALNDYSWPGNIRELQNIIERSALLQKNGKLKFQLPNETGSETSANTQTADAAVAQDRILTAKELECLERDNMQKALKACNGRVSGPQGAAMLLGLKPTTVYSRIKNWRLNV